MHEFAPKVPNAGLMPNRNCCTTIKKDKQADYMLHQWRGATDRKTLNESKFKNAELLKSRRENKSSTGVTIYIRLGIDT